jgi:hypothetical protein
VRQSCVTILEVESSGRDNNGLRYCNVGGVLVSTPPIMEDVMVRSKVRKPRRQLKSAGAMCTASTDRGGVERVTDFGRSPSGVK